MPFALQNALIGVHASIPSPPVSYFTLNIFGLTMQIHYYALCIIAGIIAATLMTNHRLTRRGGAERWVVVDICIIAVPPGDHRCADLPRADPPGLLLRPGQEHLEPVRARVGVGDLGGGIAIFGALIGGAIGAWLGCRWTGVRFSAFADALAPPASSSRRRSAGSGTGSTTSCSAFPRTCLGGPRDRAHELGLPSRARPPGDPVPPPRSSTR